MPKMDSDKRLGLLDLPPEIRNMIYELLIPAESGNIHIGNCAPSVPGGLWNRSVRRWLTPLLLTNHQVQEEWAHVAYGSITVVISTNDWAVPRLKRMGSMKKYIRNVHISRSGVTHFRSILHQLKQARYLQRLIFSHGFDGARSQEVWTPDFVAQHLGPLAKHVAKQQKSHHTSRNMSDIFCARFEDYICWEDDQDEQERKEVGIRRAEEWTTAVRRKLDEILS